MNLQEMIDRQRQITKAARSEGRSLTEEEQREFDQLQTQIEAAIAGGDEAGSSLNGKASRSAEGAGGNSQGQATNPTGTEGEDQRAGRESGRSRRFASGLELSRSSTYPEEIPWIR